LLLGLQAGGKRDGERQLTMPRGSEDMPLPYTMSQQIVVKVAGGSQKKNTKSQILQRLQRYSFERNKVGDG
jgi:hypothetical protein